ncbi:MAG TPA: DAK2 domain-containing protein, partial [Herpetosiphonaceae bacterium]
MQGLADLFEAMTNGLRQDRENLNNLDDYANGDTGDNMVYNFETITGALRQMEGQPVTVDQALNHASEVLREQGRGGTAPIYATGLAQAAQNLKGKESFGLDDLIGLLGGLMSGAANAQPQAPNQAQPEEQPAQPTAQTPGLGGLLDGLVPGITTFMQSRNAGESTIESLFKGF